MYLVEEQVVIKHFLQSTKKKGYNYCHIFIAACFPIGKVYLLSV